MTKPPRRVTSADVARASGVSRATVSYVLNNDPRQTIPDETRERVLNAARTLGYRPFVPARVLRAGYSQLVLGVLQFEQIDPANARDLKQLEAGLAAHGFSLIWYVGVHATSQPVHPSANIAPAVVIAFVDENDPTIADFLQQFGVPVLAWSNMNSRQAVGQAQVAHLVAAGQRRMVFAAPERHDVQRLAQARLAGVRQACAEHGLAPPLVQTVPFARPAARAAIANILAQQEPPFGVCCYNDEVAFTVLAALTDAQIVVPDAVAVIGCDDIPLAQFSNPPLTTISFDNHQFLDLLVRNVLAASRNEPIQAASPVPLLVVPRESA